MKPSRGDASGSALGEVWVFFALTFSISWGIGAPWLLAPRAMTAWFGPFGPTSPAYFVAAWAPTLSALILTYLRQGWPGIGQLCSGLLRWRPALLLIAAFLVLPLVALLLALLAPLRGAWPVRPSDILVATPLVMFTTAQIVTNTGPLGEELGWRGYALPRLLSRWSPAVSGLVIGLVWTLWHVPAFLFSGIVGVSLNSLGWYALGTVGLSWLMTWLFLRSRGSVLIAGVLPHFAINSLGKVGAWASRPEETMALFVLGAVLIGAETVMRRRTA